MKNFSLLERIGLLILVLGSFVFLSDNFFRIEILDSLYRYSSMLFSLGAAIWAIGYMKKKKEAKNN
tara:strand:- start:18908 stop:19105 length:198 start_codon:yes stop_codon:yes gene_type:complete